MSYGRAGRLRDLSWFTLLGLGCGCVVWIGVIPWVSLWHPLTWEPLLMGVIGFAFTVVGAGSPPPARWRRLWKCLEILAVLATIPWMLLAVILLMARLLL